MTSVAVIAHSGTTFGGGLRELRQVLDDFAVMAGAGLDALMIRDADARPKDRVGRAENSPFVLTTRGTTMRVDFDRPTAFELDGGVRKATNMLRIKVRPDSITICVPVGNVDDPAVTS